MMIVIPSTSQLFLVQILLCWNSLQPSDLFYYFFSTSFRGSPVGFYRSSVVTYGHFDVLHGRDVRACNRITVNRPRPCSVNQSRALVDCLQMKGIDRFFPITCINSS